jgi:hypothetical protein
VGVSSAVPAAAVWADVATIIIPYPEIIGGGVVVEARMIPPCLLLFEYILNLL